MRWIGFAVLVLLGGAFAMSGRAAEEKPATNTLAEASRLLKKGDYRDAALMARRLVLEKPVAADQLSKGLEVGISAYQNLGDIVALDQFRREVVSRHDDNARVLTVAAQSLLQSWPHHGTVVDGVFQRGQYGQNYVNVTEADRTQTLQWLRKAVSTDRAEERSDPEAVASVRLLKDALLWNRTGNLVWRLQEKTDYSSVPDYNDIDAHITPGGALGWPVDDDGNAIVYTVPEKWDAAANDGERLRWVLEDLKRLRPNSTVSFINEYAQFLHGQLGVGTIGYGGPRSGGTIADDVLSLSTLDDNETIARLATGVKRFELPADLNFLQMFKEAKNVDQLSNIYLDRMQYVKAEELLGEAIEAGNTAPHLVERYKQIVGNFGALQPFQSQAVGEKVALQYRFRNGSEVSFKAVRVDTAEMLADWKKGVLTGNGQTPFPNGGLGGFLVNNRPGQPSGQKYLKETAAEWDVALTPRENHFDKTETIEAPLENAGVYLVSATMKDGNTSRVIVWIDDLALVRKRLAGNQIRQLYFAADAATGKPVAGAEIELFGWRAENRPRQITTSTVNATTDANGLATVTLPERMQFLATAKASDGRITFLNPDWVWNSGRYERSRFSRTTGYSVTDRPIYRPDHEVKLHAWLCEARYDMPDESIYAGKQAVLEVVNPQGEVVHSKTAELDQFGGAGTEWKVPADAKLGQYSVRISHGGRHFSGSSFRVEEYRKPDFEVTIDQPAGAVELGKPIDVTIRADYYAGGAVAGGTVSIKVERNEYSETWYPNQPWDWLYGNGYGWRMFTPSGGRRFGGWWPGQGGPPELVLEQELTLGADGTAKITIDTEIAKTIFGDKSQKYSITAEVTDLSRRVVAASGSVVAAAEPFEVNVWSRRGFMKPGEQLPVQVSARRIGGGTVSGSATVKLIRLTRRAGETVRTVVTTEDLTIENGSAELTLPIAEAGLYRVEATVSDKKDTQSGSSEFVCRGESDGPVKDVPLTITPDKREYAVGETANLLITSTQPGTQVLLFEKVENGQYTSYESRPMPGGAMLIEVPVTQGDMPNFFYEVNAIVDGELETAVAEVYVPPSSRVLDVTVAPSEEEVGPGEEVQVVVKAVDANGDPHTGSVAFSVYDRSLDAISGGAGAGDIRDRFWSWKRGHHIDIAHSLGQIGHNAFKQGDVGLQMLGRFGQWGDAVVEEAEMLQDRAETKTRSLRSGTAAKGVPVPAAAPMEAADSMMAEPQAAALGVQGLDFGGMAAANEPVAVRESFADTAFWSGVVKTDADGIAAVSFKMPENLTAWSAKAWVVSKGTRVGQGSSEIITTKDVLVRVIAPRFLVDSDEVVLSGVIQNQTDADIDVSAVLATDGDTLHLLEDDTKVTKVPANGTARVDWRAKAVAEGEAGLTLTARSSAGSDAMRITLPVKVHGFLRTESFAGVVRDANSKSIQIVVPNDRRPEQSVLSIRVSPTVAGAIVESLPYLIEYPYGCTEQTLSRFLPAVVTRKTLSTLGVSLEEVAGMTAKLDPNVPDRVNVDDAKPVLSDAKLDDVVRTGVDRLLTMQLSDGGWGWFSGFQERSYPHTTAVVVRGLIRAREADVEIAPDAIERGLKWLSRYRAEQIQWLKNHDADLKDVRRKASADHLDAMIEMILTEADLSDETMQAYLYRDRLKLSPIGLAMVGLAFSGDPESERFRTVVSNLEQFFVGDAENGTAYLETPNRFGYWWWFGDDVEANAYALKLFLKALPKDPRVSGLARYLLNNRRNATYWKSTRDTAIAVEALNEYLAQSGELDADVTLEVVVNGVSQRKIAVTRENLFKFDGVVEIRGDAVTAGPHTVELKRAGRGPLYYAVQSTNFTMESFIPKAGLELKTERRYWKLTPRDQSTTTAGGKGQVVDINVEAYDRTPLAQNAVVDSGTLLEVELLVESKNDYEYLLLEDAKAAGFEAVEALSGYRYGFSGAYVEFRDDRVAMFFRQLNRGQHSVTYRLRAEQPGSFSALPARIQAMYAPTLVGNSDEQKLGVSEAAD